MPKFSQHTEVSYLSDALERQLLEQAIAEQFRFRPLVALKNLTRSFMQRAK